MYIMFVIKGYCPIIVHHWLHCYIGRRGIRNSFSTAFRREESRCVSQKYDASAPRGFTFLFAWRARVKPHTGIPADSQSNPCRPRRPIVEIPRKHNNLHPEHLSWPDVTISHFKDLEVIPFCKRDRLCDSSSSRSDALCG